MSTIEHFRGSAQEWDDFVRAAPGSTHCHRYGWKRVFERLFPHECVYLTARDQAGALAAVLPLVRVRSTLFGDYLVSMPFLNYGGPVGEPQSVRSLAAHAADLARERGTDLVELRSRDELDVELATSHRKITVLLDLPTAGPETLWKQLNAKVRNQVRKPQKEGVDVRFGAEHVGAFYEVFSRHMRDLGTPTQPRRLFESLVDEFGEDVWFGVAYRNGLAISAGCGFRWGPRFELTWAASLREHNPISPNMLLYWRFLERCCEQGLRTFDFGRCTPGSGTHRFKQQWGGRDALLWWYQLVRGRGATPSPNDARYSWGPRLWRRLPLSVTTVLGPRIVQYIP